MTRCYWYHEYRDMNMTVPYCEELKIDNPHCENERSCKYYISKDDADKIIRNAIESLSAEEEKENGTFVNRDNCSFNCNDSNRTLVKVVRCKDCRHAEHGTMMAMEEKDKTPRHYFDWIKCHNYDIHKGVRFVKEDDFCSWGERREE